MGNSWSSSLSLFFPSFYSMKFEALWVLECHQWLKNITKLKKKVIAKWNFFKHNKNLKFFFKLLMPKAKK